MVDDVLVRGSYTSKLTFSDPEPMDGEWTGLTSFTVTIADLDLHATKRIYGYGAAEIVRLFATIATEWPRASRLWASVEPTRPQPMITTCTVPLPRPSWPVPDIARRALPQRTPRSARRGSGRAITCAATVARRPYPYRLWPVPRRW